MIKLIWTEFNKANQLVTKEKEFKTIKASETYTKKLLKKDNINAIIGTSTEEPTTPEIDTDKMAKAIKKEIAKAKRASKKPTDIEIFAFTGMSLGTFPIVSESKNVTIVQTKKGELSFNTKTGAQLDAKNPKFGNKLNGGKK